MPAVTEGQLAWFVQFVRSVRAMRAAQVDYVQGQSREALTKSIEAEKRVDKLLNTLEKGAPRTWPSSET
jgi:hypothetical protein